MENQSIEVGEALQQLYPPFAAYVVKTRAIPDARDGLKTGARYILFAQKQAKLTYDKPRKKANLSVAETMKYSPHGDSSIYGNIIRMGQPFSLRYPIMDVKSGWGSIIDGKDYSASRYVELRSGKIAREMTELLDKNTIETWKRNISDSDDYPTVLPSKFPFSLVNGNFGIGVGCASSIPQFNIVEVCAALGRLLDNPDIAFEDIYCPIDVATGAILINEEETKESLRKGVGKAAVFRAVIEYEQDTHSLHVREIPYQVFTKTIMDQLNNLVHEEKKFTEIKSFIDATDKNGVNIIINLEKFASPEKVTRKLYSMTSLQEHYGINMMMLERGKVPKIFSWKAMMEAYLAHLQDVMKKAYIFDLQKIEARINILHGYLIAIAHIDEVIKLIKSSENPATASIKLMDSYGLNELQAKAILALRLQVLTNLEGVKINKELNEQKAAAESIKNILESEENFKIEVHKEIKRISDTYGDARRTKIMSIARTKEDSDEVDVIEEKLLIVHLTNKGNIITSESTTLLAQKRGARGSKIKMASGEYIINTLSASNTESAIFFSNLGKAYSTHLNDLPIGTKIYAGSIIEIGEGESLTYMTSSETFQKHPDVIFVTKKGMIKKSATKDYRIKRKGGAAAIKLKHEEDEIVSVLPIVGKEKVGIATRFGQLLIIAEDSVGRTGRTTSGVIGIKLGREDEVVAARVIEGDIDKIASITANGLIKSTSISEFSVGTRATKGVILHKRKTEEDTIVDFETLSKKDSELLVISSNTIVKLPVKDIPISDRATMGVKSAKLQEGQKIVKLTKEK